MFDSQIKDILERCQYPPFSNSDIESLFYFKCKHVYDNRSDETSYKLINAWENAFKFDIPSEPVYEIDTVLTEFSNKSYITVMDYILIAYCKELSEFWDDSEKIQEELDKIIKRFTLKSFIPNTEYLADIKEMVKGIRFSRTQVEAKVAEDAAKSKADADKLARTEEMLKQLEEELKHTVAEKEAIKAHADAERQAIMAEADAEKEAIMAHAEAIKAEAIAKLNEIEGMTKAIRDDCQTNSTQKHVEEDNARLKAELAELRTHLEAQKRNINKPSEVQKPLATKPPIKPQVVLTDDSYSLEIPVIETDYDNDSTKSEPPKRPYLRAVSALRCERSNSNNIPSKDVVSSIATGDIYHDIQTFREFSDKLDTNFWDSHATQSTALDIIAIYLKGQKILYIESKTFCEQILYLLMLPAIMISAGCTVLSVALEGNAWGTILVSSLTATNSFILAIVSYLKLDAKAEAHKTTSYQFDKLQTLCEFHSGKVLFFNDTKAKEVVDEIDKRVAEIKDNNQFIIPESVRYRFPVLYSTNVFTEVKKIENEENIIKNNLNIIFNQLDNASKSPDNYSKDEIRLLNRRKIDLLTDYLKSRNRYLKLDKDFNDEINKQIFGARRKFCCNPLAWLKS